MSDNVTYTAPTQVWQDITDILIGYSMRDGATTEDKTHVSGLLRSLAGGLNVPAGDKVHSKYLTPPPPAPLRAAIPLKLNDLHEGMLVQFYSDQKHVGNCRGVVEKVAKKYARVRLLDDATNTWKAGTLLSAPPENIVAWLGGSPTI